MTRYHFRYDRHNNYYYDGFFVGEKKDRMPSPEGLSVGQVNFAYVGDNSSFGTVGPLKGRRYRFDVEKYVGQANFHSGPENGSLTSILPTSNLLPTSWFSEKSPAIKFPLLKEAPVKPLTNVGCPKKSGGKSPLFTSFPYRPT